SAVRRPGSEPGPRPRPEATCWQGTEKPSESDGGQFPSHPGRPGPETSSEGAHLTPNPQEIQAGFTPLHPLPSLPLHPVIHPSIPPSLPASRRQKSPVNSKHLYGQGPIRGPPFPEPAQMKFYSLHEKITGGGGEKTENKVKQTVGEDQGREEMRATCQHGIMVHKSPLLCPQSVSDKLVQTRKATGSDAACHLERV
ncbi:DNA polymerase, partial [Dissostichus eleginoides]